MVHLCFFFSFSDLNSALEFDDIGFLPQVIRPHAVKGDHEGYSLLALKWFNIAKTKVVAFFFQELSIGTEVFD